MDQDTTPYISNKQKSNCELVPPNHADPCKFFNNFPFKAMLVLIFLVALPHFPLEAPEIITQTLHTGNWELVVQLILVGIAVSYGLFSKKIYDDETENEYLYSSSKFDANVQSRLLQASSFFDDEAENHEVSDENRVQTWNNCQYHSGKPVVVVAKESAKISPRIVEKPLLLPIRSLKSPVPEPNSTTTSPKSISTTQSKISSPRKLSTSLSVSSESQAKIDQFDHKIVRKQSFNKSSVSPPPPPPPLPPAPIVKKSTLLRSNPIVTDDKGSSKKEMRRSTRSVPFELSSYKGKSVRTIRPFVGAARARVYAKDNVNGKTEKAEETFVDKQMLEKQHYAPEPTLMDFGGEEKKTSSLEKVVLENDDSEDCFEESTENVEAASKNESDVATEGGPDNVDKKADEFIAKFREQIRLQRIQSIRTSAGQPAKELLQ
ncbi:uncharacterized protein LOC132640965 [Lycium barbarum]|uniref:uncharacterized protein LOC132640965 n=1 Tax=Lycium barbarum TaxID=112863 RepID=UPI00293ECE69|nr:uncharacterized protein LOC132640965 [Lycium barbarum]